MLHRALVILFLCLVTEGAQAQGVIADISKKTIPIEWNFHGANILLFGAIEKPAKKKVQSDVIIVVRGPGHSVLARQKKRIAGIWVNATPKEYKNVPGFYSIVSTRPLQEFAEPRDLEVLGIGLKNLSLQLSRSKGKINNQKADEYSKAIVRIMKKEGLYKESTNGIDIIGNRLFRANIKLPANVPIGEFQADVLLFQDKSLVSLSSQTLKIHKKGFEQIVYSLAYNHPILYGVIAVALAILAGLAATAIFQRD